MEIPVPMLVNRRILQLNDPAGYFAALYLVSHAARAVPKYDHGKPLLIHIYLQDCILPAFLTSGVRCQPLVMTATHSDTFKFEFIARAIEDLANIDSIAKATTRESCTICLTNSMLIMHKDCKP